MTAGFDRSWQALLDPADADDWFEGMAPPQRWPGPEFDRTSAGFLAELCRLVYQRAPDRRRTAVHRVGWTEAAYLAHAPAHCGLYTPPAGLAGTAIVFRGTSAPTDWLTNLDVRPCAWFGGGTCHRGFCAAIESIRAPLDERLRTLPRPWYVTGHSLGGALALLAASWLRPDGVCTFGAPKTGDGAFARALRGIRIYRVVNGRDLVAQLPPGDTFGHAGRLRRIGPARVRRPDAGAFWQELQQARIRPLGSALLDAPEPLSDHSPVNYVRALCAPDTGGADSGARL